MYRVDLRPGPQKSLLKIQTQERLRIISTLLGLEQNPRPRGMDKVRGTELWRIRVGDFQVIFDINDKEKLITIVKIGHRREIYRGF